MSFDSLWPIMNGRTSRNVQSKTLVEELDNSLKTEKSQAVLHEIAEFHGDRLLGNKQSKLTGILYDLEKVFSPQHIPEVLKVATKIFSGERFDVRCLESLFKPSD